MKSTTLLILLFFLQILPGCFNRKTKEREKLPSFKIELLDGTALDTQNIPDGDPVILMLFGPFCEYSRKQMEDILKDLDLLKDIKFYLVTIESKYDLKLFYDHYKLENYQNITAGVDINNFFITHFHASHTPTLYIYGKDKQLRGIRNNIYGREIYKLANSN